MAQKTPMDVLVGLLADATEEFSKLSLRTGKTPGQRMQEMEQEIERLQFDLAQAWDAIPHEFHWALGGQDSLPTTIHKFCEQWKADQELREAAVEAERQWEVRWENLRVTLIGHGLGIDDDTTDELLQALRTELTALSTLRARVKSQQERLDKRDANAAAAEELAERDRTIEQQRLVINAAREELTAIRAAVAETPTLHFLHDDGPLDIIATVNHMVTVLRNRDANAQAEQQRLNAELIELRTRNERQFADLTTTRQELTKLSNTHHEWVNGQRQKPPSLNDLMTKMNDVIVAQMEMLSPTSGTYKAVDIRRRMLAKYSVEHDAAQLPDEYLINRALDAIGRREPEGLLEAAALLIAHYDAIREASK